MSEQVKIYINVRDGELNVEASVDSLENIFSKLETFVPHLIQSYQQFNPIDDENDIPEDIFSQTQTENSEINHLNGQKKGKVKQRSRKNSSSTKKTYSLIEIDLSPEQRQDFRNFYQSKKPKGQNQQLLVIMYWLSKNANIHEFTDDIIYTGLKAVDERTPGRINAVMNNLKGEGMITGSNGKFKLHHNGEDLVSFNLPSESK